MAALLFVLCDVDRAPALAPGGLTDEEIGTKGLAGEGLAGEGLAGEGLAGEGLAGEGLNVAAGTAGFGWIAGETGLAGVAVLGGNTFTSDPTTWRITGLAAVIELGAGEAFGAAADGPADFPALPLFANGLSFRAGAGAGLALPLDRDRSGLPFMNPSPAGECSAIRPWR